MILAEKKEMNTFSKFLRTGTPTIHWKIRLWNIIACAHQVPKARTGKHQQFFHLRIGNGPSRYAGDVETEVSFSRL